MSLPGSRFWRSVQRNVLLARGARENAHEAMLEAQLQVSRRRQAMLALAAAGAAAPPVPPRYDRSTMR